MSSKHTEWLGLTGGKPVALPSVHARLGPASRVLSMPLTATPTAPSTRLVSSFLVLASFASAAAYLQLADASKRGLLPEHVSLQQLVQQHTLPLLPAELAAPAQQALTAAQQLLASAWPAAAQRGAVLAHLRLRELLPHATYALCCTAAALWLAAVTTGRLRGAAATTAAAQLALAVLVQVSERGAPLILLLALLQLAAMARLLARRAEVQPPGGAAGVAGEAGALVALVAAQLFYATGHMCEFAGLQYTAGAKGWVCWALLCWWR